MKQQIIITLNHKGPGNGDLGLKFEYDPPIQNPDKTDLDELTLEQQEMLMTALMVTEGVLTKLKSVGSTKIVQVVGED